MNNRNGAFIFISVISCIGSAYLVWWHNLDKYSGIYELNGTDSYAIAIGICLIIIAIFSLVRLFWSQKYLFTFWLALSGLLCAFGLLEIRTVVELKGCDMSVCNDLELKRNGTFKLTSRDQIETGVIHGKYFYFNDTLYLNSDTTCDNQDEYLKLNTFKRKHTVILVNFGYWRVYGL